MAFCLDFGKALVNGKLNNNSSSFVNSNYKLTFSSLGEALSNSITSAISTILMIGGFVVIFSVIISIFKVSHVLSIFNTILTPTLSIFNIPNQYISPLLVGILEITNGISLISYIKIRELSLSIIITAFLLGMGGISIFLQVFSITSKSDLSIKPYILGKLSHGIIAAFYTFLFIQFFPIFNLNL